MVLHRVGSNDKRWHIFVSKNGIMVFVLEMGWFYDFLWQALMGQL